MMRNDALDSFDLRLLRLMQQDVQRPVAAMAEAVGLSVPACYRRMRRLRASGAIDREVAIVKPRTLGWPLSMIVLVTLEREGAGTMGEMMALLRAAPEVIEAWNVTGDYDIAVKMIARDMERYDDSVQRLFTANERVRAFKTLVVIRQLKEPSPAPIPGA